MTTSPPRRWDIVLIPRAEHTAALADLQRQIATAQASENIVGRRQGTRSKAATKALQFDKLNAKADAEATKVQVNELAYDEFGPLQDLHPPRSGDEQDKRAGYNRDTFPLAVLKASLVEQDSAEDVDDLVAKGDAAFAALKPSLGRLQYARLERAAWQVNVGDDALPLFSAVSLLKAANERGSQQQPDSE